MRVVAATVLLVIVMLPMWFTLFLIHMATGWLNWTAVIAWPPFIMLWIFSTWAMFFWAKRR